MNEVSFVYGAQSRRSTNNQQYRITPEEDDNSKIATIEEWFNGRRTSTYYVTGFTIENFYIKEDTYLGVEDEIVSEETLDEFRAEVRETTRRLLFTDRRFATEWDVNGDSAESVHIRELTDGDEWDVVLEIEER